MRGQFQGLGYAGCSQVVQDAAVPLLVLYCLLFLYNSLDIYAKEKSKLRKQGLLIDDFDILIGATAVANNMTMVTNNVAHLGRLDNIEIEDWTTVVKR